MASHPDFVAYVCQQMHAAGQISSKKMFGEYALYCNEKVVALVCDDQVYLKPTTAVSAILTTPIEAPPYPGAKNHWLINELLDDQELLARLVQLTYHALPVPKPKKPKTAKPPKGNQAS